MRRVVIATLGMLMAAAALAQPVSLPGAVRLDDATLATVRGGFTSPATGLVVSFGIERAVYAGGSDAAATLVRSATGGGIVLVQRGSGNSFDIGSLSGLASSTSGTVIQNSLDNQKIQAVTTIDVKTNSLQVLSAASLRSSVSNAVTASLRR